MLAIVDYGAGNQTSVRRALGHLGIDCAITADPARLEDADGVIFPGVGAAGQAMAELRRVGLDRRLRDLAARGRPLLGICLGCQILLAHSEENDTDTLGMAPGLCRRFPDHMREEDGTPAPVPHMGWNRLRLTRPSALFAGIPETAQFYFVHSYYAVPEEAMVLATATYGLEFCAAYGRGNLLAVQFHPEKSGRPGLRLLQNFAAICEARHAQ